MNVSKRTAVAMLTVAAIAGSATTAVTAVAHQGKGRSHSEDGNRLALFTSLAPSVPTDPTLLGAAAGAVPWVLHSGEAKLHTGGRLTVRLRGLLIPSGQFAGTTGPVQTVSASADLRCGYGLAQTVCASTCCNRIPPIKTVLFIRCDSHPR
jgi:hypothetical protein